MSNKKTGGEPKCLRSASSKNMDTTFYSADNRKFYTIIIWMTILWLHNKI